MTSLDTIRRRLDRIEASRGSAAPTRISADRPMEPGKAAEALANRCAWRSIRRVSSAVWGGGKSLWSPR